MPSKRGSFFTDKIGPILGVFTLVVIAAVGISVAKIDIISLFRTDGDHVKTWQSYVIGTWEFEDRDGGAQIFQFHPNGRYDYYLKINPTNSGGFGNYKVINATDETAVLDMTPAADRSAKWKLYMKRIDSGNIDIRMGDPEGEDYTRLTRI